MTPKETILIILSILVLVALFRLPIHIAKLRKVSKDNLTTVKILTWTSLITGITWLIALIMACCYEPKKRKSKR